MNTLLAINLQNEIDLFGNGLLIGQAIIFSTLVCMVMFFLWYVRRLQRQLFQDRMAAIEEVRKTADDLAQHTQLIAERVRKETVVQAAVTASELEAKINELLRRFNHAGIQQETVQEIVSSTEKIVEEEFDRYTKREQTTRDQIDDIQKTATDIKEKIIGPGERDDA